MTVDRMSALDECFLRLESETAHMHVGWVLLAEGPAPTLEELREHVRRRLELLPRFRRRVLAGPLGVDPVWVDDARFDLNAHVRGVRLQSPGARAHLHELAGELLSMPLARERPLWRLHLVDGVSERSFAIVGQAHHALVDGIAAVEMAQLLLTAEPASAALSPPRPFRPAPPPGLIARAAASAAERARLTRSAASVAMRALANPAGVGELLDELRRLAEGIATVGTPAPRTALNCTIGPRRSIAFADLPLHLAKEVGRRCDATVNDVVLAAAALALGRHLRRAGEAHPWLRALVPVSTRPGDDGRSLGNRLSAMFVELPIGERDPRAALEEVARQTRRHKDSRDSAAIDHALAASGLLPAALRDALAWFLTRPKTFNVVVSNVPGPRDPLYLLGRRVSAAYPAVPLVAGHAVSVGALSYCGTLHVALYADAHAVPGTLDLARDVRRSFEALRSAILPRSPRPRPPRGSAHRRALTLTSR